MTISEWKRLDINDLRKILSQDEVERLDTLSLGEGQTQAINNILDLVSDTWRGAFSSKGYYVDVREHYTPPTYHYWILVHARHACWARFPNSGQIALDDPREKEYEKALEILAKPTQATPAPDYSSDPVLSGDTSLYDKQDAAILVPDMRIKTWHPIWKKTTPSAGDIAGRDIFGPSYPETPPNLDIDGLVSPNELTF